MLLIAFIYPWKQTLPEITINNAAARALTGQRKPFHPLPESKGKGGEELIELIPLHFEIVYFVRLREMEKCTN